MGVRARLAALAAVVAAVGGAVLLLDFPVSVAVWGDVASWFEAIGTSSAAIGAALFYVLDSRRRRSAQARLVRTKLSVFDGQQFGITVYNDSDRTVSDFSLFREERSLAWSLYNRDQFEITQMRYDTRRKRVVRITLHTSTPLQHIKNKNELLGYDGSSSLGFGHWSDKRVLASNRRVYLPCDYAGVTYRRSSIYWLLFTDADGITWRREVLHPDEDGPGSLCHVPNVDHLFPQPRKRRRKAIAHYVRVRLWLFRHRNERTSTEAEHEARREEDTRLLLAKYEPENRQSDDATSADVEEAEGAHPEECADADAVSDAKTSVSPSTSPADHLDAGGDHRTGP